MFSVFIATLSIMLLVVAVMSIGIMFNRQPIKGSCGGIGGGECCRKKNCKKKSADSIPVKNV